MRGTARPPAPTKNSRPYLPRDGRCPRGARATATASHAATLLPPHITLTRSAAGAPQIRRRLGALQRVRLPRRPRRGADHASAVASRLLGGDARPVCRPLRGAGGHGHPRQAAGRRGRSVVVIPRLGALPQLHLPVLSERALHAPEPHLHRAPPAWTGTRTSTPSTRRRTARPWRPRLPRWRRAEAPDSIEKERLRALL